MHLKINRSDKYKYKSLVKNIYINLEKKTYFLNYVFFLKEFFIEKKIPQH